MAGCWPRACRTAACISGMSPAARESQMQGYGAKVIATGLERQRPLSGHRCRQRADRLGFQRQGSGGIARRIELRSHSERINALACRPTRHLAGFGRASIGGCCCGAWVPAIRRRMRICWRMNVPCCATRAAATDWPSATRAAACRSSTARQRRYEPTSALAPNSGSAAAAGEYAGVVRQLQMFSEFDQVNRCSTRCARRGAQCSRSRS